MPPTRSAAGSAAQGSPHLLIPEQRGVDMVHAGSQVHTWQPRQLRQQTLRLVAAQPYGRGERGGHRGGGQGPTCCMPQA